MYYLVYLKREDGYRVAITSVFRFPELRREVGHFKNKAEVNAFLREFSNPYEEDWVIARFHDGVVIGYKYPGKPKIEWLNYRTINPAVRMPEKTNSTESPMYVAGVDVEINNLIDIFAKSRESAARYDTPQNEGMVRAYDRVLSTLKSIQKVNYGDSERRRVLDSVERQLDRLMKSLEVLRMFLEKLRNTPTRQWATLDLLS